MIYKTLLGVVIPRRPYVPEGMKRNKSSKSTPGKMLHSIMYVFPSECLPAG